MALIGLDIGTTGSKCTIFDTQGNVCAYAYKEYQVINPYEDYYELNPNEVWEAVKYVINMAVKKFSGDKLLALSVSSLGEAAVPVSKDGEVLYNSMLYMDHRGTKQAEALKEKLGKKEIMRLTGLNVHPMYTINKVMWLKDNMPEIYHKTWKFMLFGEFILYKLGKIPVIDYSLASRTMAFNIIEKRWETKIFEAAGIKQDLFSEAVPSGSMIGEIDNEIAKSLGLPNDLKLVSGAHDQVCAAIGSGVVEGKRAAYGIGTVECITPIYDNPTLNEQMRKNNFACVPYAKENIYTTYAFNFSGGSLLKWFRDNFAHKEILEAKKENKNVYALLDEKASRKPSDLILLPHFAGAGTPYMDTNAVGGIVGLNMQTKSEEIYRAILEGVTFEMRYNLECLKDSGIEVDVLRAVGGGAKSELWLQMKADIMNKKIEVLEVDEAGTLGTIILAGVAIGLYPSLEEAARQLVKVRKIYTPLPKMHEFYTEKYRKYKKMYSAVKEIMF